LVRFRIAKTNELGESILTPKFAVKWNAFDKALKDILAEIAKNQMMLQRTLQIIWHKVAVVSLSLMPSS